jgi:hypothetical protein
VHGSVKIELYALICSYNLIQNWKLIVHEYSVTRRLVFGLRFMNATNAVK